MNSIGKIGIVMVLGIAILLTSVSCGGGISQEEYADSHPERKEVLVRYGTKRPAAVKLLWG